MSVFIKNVSLHGLRINGGLVPLSSNIIFWAPLTASTGSTDITANPLVAAVSTPVPTTITYTGTDAVFYSLGSSGTANQPSLSYGTVGVSTKLNASLYPTQTVYFSVVVNLTGVNLGNTDACQIMSWDAGGGNYIVFYAYVSPSQVRVLTGIQLGGGTNITEFNGAFPTGNVALAMVWYPSGTLEYSVNDSVVRTTTATRFTGGVLSVGGSSNRNDTSGIYEMTLKDVKYNLSPQMYAWSTTGFSSNRVAVWSNSDCTVTCNRPNSSFVEDSFFQSMQPLSGKVYCEFDCTSSAGNIYNSFGVQSSPTNSLTRSNGVSVYSYGIPVGSSPFIPDPGLEIYGGLYFNSAYYFTYGDRIGIAFDVSTKKIWFSKNGAWISGDPAAGTGESSTLTTGSPFYFTWGNYSWYGDSAGDYSYTIYPNSATQTYSPPAGFVRYQA